MLEIITITVQRIYANQEKRLEVSEHFHGRELDNYVFEGRLFNKTLKRLREILDDKAKDLRLEDKKG